MKRTLPVLLFAALAGLAACKGDSTGPGPKLTLLSVSPNPVYLGVGDTTRLSATGTSASGSSVTVTPSYTSQNPSIASVTSDGLVRGVAVGVTNVIAKAGGKTDTTQVNVLSTGGVKTFNVNTDGDQCTPTTYHAARLAASSAHANIYEDVTNPPGGFTAAEYQSIITDFENIVWDTDTQNFGTPTDLDANGKIDILYTRAVNELTPSNVNYIIGGFFDPRDVFPRTAQNGFPACPGSNYSEMFYILVPDTAGTINGNKRSKAYVRQSTVGTLAHEFQHLINTSRRFYVNNADSTETVWLDEGLAHVAEELAFHAASGIGTRTNIGQAQILGSQQALDAFNNFAIQNFGRFETYLQNPAPNSPWADNDDLETRGATWSWLRYMADRRGGSEQSFWFGLVNSQKSGLVNLQQVLGSDPVLQARDWSVANYTDDAVPTSAVFQHLTWNFRDVYANKAFGGYPLNVQQLGAGTTTLSIKSGSAAYLRFGVAAGQQGDVRFAPTGTPSTACSTLNMAVGEVQQIVMGTGLVLCLPGGAAGEEYVAIPFHANAASDVTTSLTVTAANLVTAAGPPTPDRASAHAPLFALDAVPLGRPYDGGWELRFRKRVWDALAPRMANRLRPHFAAAAGPSTVYINIVRTK